MSSNDNDSKSSDRKHNHRDAGIGYKINADGWCEGAVWQASPNFDARPADDDISLLLIHNISLPPEQFGGPYIADLFGNRLAYDAHPYFEKLRPLRVSSHF